jgi:hypothetical protein
MQSPACHAGGFCFWTFDPNRSWRACLLLISLIHLSPSSSSLCIQRPNLPSLDGPSREYLEGQAEQFLTCQRNDRNIKTSSSYSTVLSRTTFSPFGTNPSPGSFPARSPADGRYGRQSCPIVPEIGRNRTNPFVLAHASPGQAANCSFRAEISAKAVC